MLRMLWSVKGGAGVSVVAAALARGCALDGPTVLVDLAGDQPAVLGLPDPGGPGVTEWLNTPERSEEALRRLALDVSRNWMLVPRGRAAVPDLVDWADVAMAISSLAATVVVDAGLRRVGEPAAGLSAAVGAVGSSILVTRPCYLALRRASHEGVGDADGVAVVVEAGRPLDARDVGEVVGLPVLAEIDLDPRVARHVDAGTFARRPERGLQRSVRSLA